MGGFISFLGGAAFRMIWGELSAFINKSQDHKHEVELLRLQGELDDKAHQHSIEIAKLQNELQVRQVEVVSDALLEKAAADTFSIGAGNLSKPSGIRWVDGWKSSIQPQFAQIALCLWLYSVYARNWELAAFDIELISSILGLFTADRMLHRRGK